MTALRKFGTLGLILLASLAALDAYLASQALARRAADGAVPSPIREYFLDVGEGESELIILPGNVKVLIDAGPAGAAAKALAAILPSDDRYLDLAIVSYPSPDRFGGFADLLDHYGIGAFLWSGRVPDGATAGEWRTLLAKVRSKHVPIIAVGAGDRIMAGAGAAVTEPNATAELDILSPNGAFLRSADPTEASLVALAVAAARGRRQALRTLFMGAADASVERYLLSRGIDLRADILKAASHGTRHATSAAFLRAVRPAIVVIEAGGKTAAGLPSKETLARIASSTAARVFRTDANGTVAVWPDGGGASIVTSR